MSGSTDMMGYDTGMRRHEVNIIIKTAIRLVGPIHRSSFLHAVAVAMVLLYRYGFHFQLPKAGCATHGFPVGRICCDAKARIPPTRTQTRTQTQAQSHGYLLPLPPNQFTGLPSIRTLAERDIQPA